SQSEINTLSLHDALPICDERVLGHAADICTDFSGLAASGISQASEKPCELMPSAVLLLVDRLAKAMHAVSSTTAAGPSCSSRRRSEEHTSELQSLAYLVC